jgi:hypothetical protein
MGDAEGSKQCFDRAGAILRRLRAGAESDGDAGSNSDTKYVLAAPSMDGVTERWETNG